MADDRKVALVTGGAVRVGRAIVERLCQAGYHVAFTFMSSADLAKEVAEANRAIAIQADLTKPQEASDSIARALNENAERLHVIVNNASDFVRQKLANTTLDQIHRLNAIHVETPLLLAQRFESRLRANLGHIVNMLDLFIERPPAEYLAYSASKSALANLTLGLARALAPEVTVNGVSPGVVDWPRDTQESEKLNYLKRVPLARAGTPQDVANLVHFLCTEGSYITGQIIRLDGGRSIT